MRLSLHPDLPTGDPYLPGHGDPSWSATHYALVLDYEVEGNMLRGEAVIDAVAEPDEGELSRVVLDLAGLDVARVSVDGRPPAKYAAAASPSDCPTTAPGAAPWWRSSSPSAICRAKITV